MRPEFIGELTLAVSDWIDANLDHFQHGVTMDDDFLYDSLTDVIDRKLSPYINEDWGN
jgi:hypothetical protein